MLGFNAIREIVKINKDTQMLKEMFENVFNSTDHQKLDSLVNFIAATEEKSQTCVKIKEKDMAVPAGKVLHVQCKADVGFLERKILTMFQELKAELPEGISAADSVMTIQKGVNKYFHVPFVNSSKHDIALPNVATPTLELLSVSNQ